MPTLQIPEKLERFATTPKRYKIAYGGRGGAKSKTFGQLFLMKSQTEAAKVGCFREFQNSIDDSVHSLLKDEIRELQLPGFSTTNNSISNEQGGEFTFKGLSRNPDSVQSMNAYDYFWIEEGHSITKKSFEKLDPTLRKNGSELWVSMNPQSSLDYMSKRFIEPYKSELLKNGYYEDDLHLIVCINYCDNPWFPDTLEQVRKADYERLSRSEYNHIWLGHYNDRVDGSIIKPEWVDAAIDAHVKMRWKESGTIVAGYDPADSGDAKAVAVRHGSVVKKIFETTTGDVNSCTDWALEEAAGCDVFAWDVDGLGVSLRRQVAESNTGRRAKLVEFRGSGEPENPNGTYTEPGRNTEGRAKSNKDAFFNQRAQHYWRLRDRLYNTYRAAQGEYVNPDEMISICSDAGDVEKLKAELCQIPKVPNPNGKIQMMRKDVMKSKLGINSPNLADALMMTMGEYDLTEEEIEPIYAGSIW